MTKRLLIIDNDDLTESIQTINDLAKKKNVKVECFPFHIGLPDGNDVINENGKIDFNLVLAKFKEKFGLMRFHMMASDFKLNDELIDGVEVLRRFQDLPNIKKANKILYSSELEEIVQKYLDDYKEGTKNFQDSWASFRTLIKLNIIDFSKREDIEKNIVNYIEKINEDDDDFILEELFSNSDLTFNPSMEIYEGLTFQEVAEKILNNDSQSENFKRKLIHLAISNISYLQNE